MFSKVSFRLPKNIDLLVFNQCNFHILRKVIPEKYSYAIYPQDPGIFWFNTSAFIRLAVDIFTSKFWFEVRHPKGKFYGFLRALYLYYIKSIILTINPRGVISYIDNSDIFSWLAKNCNNMPFFAVQNGARLSVDNLQYNKLHFDYYFSYGEHEKYLFNMFGWTSKQIFPVGSLAAALYGRDRSKTSFFGEYDLLIVSSWRGNIGYTKSVQDTMRSMRIMDEKISDYLSVRSIKAAIILRSEVGDKDWYMNELGKTEEEYYLSIYSNKVDIIKNNFETRPIYELMLNSKVVIACLSTALFEALSYKKKIMFFNFSENESYHKDIPELFKCSDPNRLCEILDKLIEGGQDIYQGEYQALAMHYMSSFKDMDTRKAIPLIIDAIISGNTNLTSNWLGYELQ